MFSKLTNALGLKFPAYPPLTPPLQPTPKAQLDHVPPFQNHTRRQLRRPADLYTNSYRAFPQSIPLLEKATKLGCMPKQGAFLRLGDVSAITKFLIDEFLDAGARNNKIGVVLKSHFHAIDQVFSLMELRTNTRLGHAKFDTKKAVLQCAIDKSCGKPMDIIDAFQQTTHFPGKGEMLISVARERMERDVRLHYSLPTSSGNAPVRRYLTRQLSNVSQGDYVLHVCGLFNLESKIDTESLEKIHSKLDAKTAAELTRALKHGEPLIGVKYKHAIPYLLSCFPIDGTRRDAQLRNTHPASVMLSVASGFIFHPGQQNTALLNSNSPFSFENIGRTMALKYFEAKHHKKLPEFFDTAFIKEEPCYEATVQNIMNFSPNASAAETIFHAKPKWDDVLPTTDNVSGFLIWLEREMVRDFAKESAIDLKNCSLKDINAIEGSRAYAEYLMRNKSEIESRMLAETHTRVPRSQLREIIQDDLELGLASAND